MYESGRGVDQDDATAAEWFQKAAESGLSEAQFNLASIYDWARATDPNGAGALYWYRKAADAGVEKPKPRVERLER